MINILEMESPVRGTGVGPQLRQHHIIFWRFGELQHRRNAMFATKAVRPFQIRQSQFQCLRNFSSTAAARQLQLAYDHYPAPEGTTTKHDPIVFIHGLFGSKKNNRSMSKYIPPCKFHDRSDNPQGLRPRAQTRCLRHRASPLLCSTPPLIIQGHAQPRRLTP